MSEDLKAITPKPEGLLRHTVSQQVVALCSAAASVRGGTWVDGAPTHLFPALLRALEAKGWELRRMR